MGFNPLTAIARFVLFRYARRATGNVVFRGPFQGMKYVRESTGSVYIPKVLGTYEKELNDVVEDIARRGFPLVVDVGAAEGYYAVGLARRMPDATIVTFEAEKAGWTLMESMARLNDVEGRISPRGCCDAASLREVLHVDEPCCVIMDVEGAEQELLDPAQVPALKNCFIVVELHHFFVEGITDLLKERFAATHDIKAIDSQSRTADDYPLPIPKLARRLFSPFWRLLMYEFRPEPMQWYVMSPHQESPD